MIDLNCNLLLYKMESIAHTYDEDAIFSTEFDIRNNFGTFNLNEVDENFAAPISYLAKILDGHNIKEDRMEMHLSEENSQSELPLSWDDPNLISQMKTRYKESGKKVIINKVLPLIDKSEFYGLVVKECIPFSSKEDPNLANKYCNALLELGKLKGLRKAGNPRGGQNYIDKANEFAKQIGPILDQIDKEGYNSYNKKADYLNGKKVKAILGGQWRASSVRGVWKRWQQISNSHKM